MLICRDYRNQTTDIYIALLIHFCLENGITMTPKRRFFNVNICLFMWDVINRSKSIIEYVIDFVTLRLRAIARTIGPRLLEPLAADEQKRDN